VKVTIGVKFNLHADYEMHEGWFEVKADDLVGEPGFDSLSFFDKYSLLHFLAEHQALMKMRGLGYIDTATYETRSKSLVLLLLTSRTRAIAQRLLNVGLPNES